jgi:hypothetical protein
MFSSHLFFSHPFTMTMTAKNEPGEVYLLAHQKEDACSGFAITIESPSFNRAGLTIILNTRHNIMAIAR